MQELMSDHAGRHKLSDFVLRYHHTAHILKMGETRFRKDDCKWAGKKGYRNRERMAVLIFATAQNGIPVLPDAPSTQIVITEANELDLADPQEYRERRYEQKKALTECKTVLFLIELSFEKELISSEQCAEWTRHVMNVKNMTAKWRKQDRERFAALQQNRGIMPRR